MQTATLAAAIAALERHLGFRRGRLVSMAQRLQNAGAIPTGAPRTPPQLTLANVVDLVVAYAADAPLHLAARSVATYGALTPGGANLDGAPARVKVTAAEYLTSIAALAAGGDTGIRRLKLEFVSTWPELAVHFEVGSIHRFQAVGALPDHWQASGHRQSLTINGAAFADAIREIFH
ncbi:hypothetical protein ABID08_006540 [Rhizobium binae]|uniref:Uncharacterized protein n=1 Tax=Rhizobium binae TaxID=1138190 RepID=A0ABV2MRS2_9HYPH|nr:hypothetical protein [Rhizobium binae]MBX4993850.1 hypothetical protein [Rhizobium binae]NKL52100.1 hypothetical protein [Rhizobium leguminosarum bv. viciae]QSY83272.1 hypothetical protein J2J99_05510 [Rhizobium binae]